MNMNTLCRLLCTKKFPSILRACLEKTNFSSPLLDPFNVHRTKFAQESYNPRTTARSVTFLYTSSCRAWTFMFDETSAGACVCLCVSMHGKINSLFLLRTKISPDNFLNLYFDCGFKVRTRLHFLVARNEPPPIRGGSRKFSGGGLFLPPTSK